ncbi:DUF4367 domain-containing protein [bacterium AH-315-E09]|nr:DUF4367 domain-containing protein [bacterium AH-315-G05]MBN4074553.1 DUF4367 domain-containing protein [bacterium AH-315-E09]
MELRILNGYEDIVKYFSVILKFRCIYRILRLILSRIGEVIGMSIDCLKSLKGIIIEKEKSNIISWHDNNKSYYIQGNVEKTMLLKIAESLMKKN